MIFRYNMFGESIAQPDAKFFDIEQSRIDISGIDIITIDMADLYTTADEQFKFGGSLFGREGFFVPDDDSRLDEATANDFIMEFDGFDTLEAARDWLLTLGVTPRITNEVDA